MKPTRPVKHSKPMKFYSRAIKYVADNLGKKPYDELVQELNKARMMDEFVAGLQRFVDRLEASR